ncbi:hypothetical protein [Streptomyces sp. NPDC002619]|uniref:hypothetical protein n=1 Tax=Streptomyces sp. NPDC002619 TaxID=3364655 RepID=UPI00369E9C54
MTEERQTPNPTEPADATEVTAAAEQSSGPADASAPVVLPVSPVRDRRVLRAVLRWTAVAAVFAVCGAGTAYGIVRMDRTDVPGLATESDGRWTYPEITRPPLPPGSLGPLDTKNWAGSHYADLRALLLPVPTGATRDKALRGTGGWLAKQDFLDVYAKNADREKIGQLLTDYGLRHIAARGWTTADGTRTGIYLLQFDTSVVAEDVYGELTQYDSPVYPVRGADVTEFDDGYPSTADVHGIERYAYAEVKPYGAAQVRQAYLRAADTLAVIVQSRKGTTPAIPFQQTVTLQSQLLG